MKEVFILFCRKKEANSEEWVERVYSSPDKAQKVCDFCNSRIAKGKYLFFVRSYRVEDFEIKSQKL